MDTNNLNIFLKFLGVIYLAQFLGALDVLQNIIPAAVNIMLR